MKLGRCPVCHSHISFESMVQDQSARELIGLFAGLDDALGRALAGYLGLFRSQQRDLPFDRALRLANQVLDLTQDTARLSAALAETVTAIRAKTPAKPMKNHNYLKQVLANTEAPAALPAVREHLAPRSQTAKAINALMGRGDD